MTFRIYDPERDKEAVHRIWYEIGWLEKKEEEKAMDLFVTGGRAMVAEIDGAAECLVLSTPGTIRYMDRTLPFAGVTGVTTSRIARKQGFASRLTAHVIALDAAEGALVSGLGMFEQGFYNQLGMGTGGYEHRVSFDPARLRVPIKARVPRRITADDWEMVHASRLARIPVHGALNFTPLQCTHSEMMWARNGFGLGYCDGPDGALSHHLWCHVRDVGHGPYNVLWMSYRTREQFLELMALLKNLGDQVRVVRMCEPAGIQLQDMIEQPFQREQISAKTSFETGVRAKAYWQMRICDLEGCLSQTHLCCAPLRFTLRLSDPIGCFLDADVPWRGVGGEYVVTLGAESGLEVGADPSLPTLDASVGAFTRMWLGARPASGLAVTDDLTGPEGLLRALDRAFCLPDPKPDWDF